MIVDNKKLRSEKEAAIQTFRTTKASLEKSIEDHKTNVQNLETTSKGIPLLVPVPYMLIFIRQGKGYPGVAYRQSITRESSQRSNREDKTARN